MSSLRRAVRAALTVVVLASSTAACSSGGAEAVSGDRLDDLALDTGLQPRRFVARSTIAGRVLEVSGIVEDDHRYAAEVRIDGEPVYDEVVADDARYLRLHDPAELAPADRVGELPTLDPAYASLVTGSWVVDVNGAPPEFTSGSKPATVPLAPQLVLDRVRFLDTLPELVKNGATEYNTDSVSYLPKNDKFVDIEVPGATRFDLFPAAYDPNTITVTLVEVAKFFEYAAVWADADGIVRVERHLELPEPGDDTYEEMYRQIARAGSEPFVNMIRLGAAGRLLTESYEVVLDPAARVAVPADAAVVDLDPALATSATAFAAAIKVPGPLTGRPT